MFPMLIPSVQTQQRVLWPGAPRQAGFQRVHGLLHALSHLARGAGRVGGTGRKRAGESLPGRLSVKHFSHGSDSVSGSYGVYSMPSHSTYRPCSYIHATSPTSRVG